MSDRILTCAECDEMFPDYFEGDLGATRTAMLEAHASSCARCQGLIRDVREITAAAGSLPELVPSRDLWSGIEKRIQPGVVPIGEWRHGVHVSRQLLGAAAAALVVISSGVTYLATRSPESPDGPARVAATMPRVSVEGTSPDDGPAAEVATPSEVAASPITTGEERGRQQTPTLPKRTPVTAVKQSMTVAERSIAPEIEQLQALLVQRRNQLDPSTVKVVEDNLALIDAALKQAREALMRDPASGFLTEQVDGVLQKKVQLLRTVALLPSRS